ncbi:MAG TPA: hypothetical protein VEX60_00490 [Pyrinomonadaceae bacterium]|nr:hypothetical protein [Pyrinomonadaceae bacterium]
MKRLTNLEEIEDARHSLAEHLEARGEWFLREGRGGASVALRRGEWELRVAAGALQFSYWGEAGARTWRVMAWERQGEGARLECVRRMGAERGWLELVPRALVASAREAVAEARRRECETIAALACDVAGAKRERAALSAGARRGEPGRWARILLRRGRERIAVAAPVVPVGAEGAESFLASALLWLARLEGRAAHTRPNALWLVAQQTLCAAIRDRLALLRDDLRARISVFEVDEERAELTQVRAPELSELLDVDAPRLLRPVWQPPGEFVASVVALAPEAVDVVRARRGETLRFNGLPFVRVRRMSGVEQVWFGVERASRRRLLGEACAEDLLHLIAELKEHRRADAPDRKHALYRAAPEAWLESILRRDITRLDPGLRLAPLHAQFRASRETGGASRPVDLLALRRDGRLVVIELKVSEDAALALQGADYWRRISTQHRAGNIKRASLFGDAEISDEAPLVYMVAPLLRFHRAFQILARAIRPEVEMFRFCINEDWRAGVRVARRERIG